MMSLHKPPLRKSRWTLLLAFLIYCALVALRISRVSTHVETLASNARQIIDQEMQAFISSMPATKVRPGTARLQNMLNCGAHRAGTIGFRNPSTFPNTTCSHKPSPDLVTTAATRICEHLAGKRVVLVGPLTTYHLHNLWLDALEAHEGHSLNCPGPEFCIFHHICYPGRNGSSYLDGDKQRFPKNQELRDTQSAVLQYVLSSSLVAHRNKDDYIYTRPVMDPRTNIRMRNYYWLRKAQKANIVVLSQAPVPAPPDSYAQYQSNEQKGYLWGLLSSFLTVQTLQEDLVYLALNATFSTFLPSLRDAIHAIRADSQIRNSLIVWHGHWPLDPQCTNSGLPKHIPRVEQFWSSKTDRVDPWTFYYNVQVHIQDYMLPRLLPRFDVLYLPISLSPIDRGINVSPDSETRKDCTRVAQRSPGPDFFIGLFELLKQASA